MSYKFLDLPGLQRFLNKVKALIPVKTSELQNDSGYTTADTALSGTSENAESIASLDDIQIAFEMLTFNTEE